MARDRSQNVFGNNGGLTDEEIIDLADRFCSRERAMAVLDAAGIPKRRRPRWEDDPDRFWFEISELVQILNGEGLATGVPDRGLGRFGRGSCR